MRGGDSSVCRENVGTFRSTEHTTRPHWRSVHNCTLRLRPFLFGEKIDKWRIAARTSWNTLFVRVRTVCVYRNSDTLRQCGRLILSLRVTLYVTFRKSVPAVIIQKESNFYWHGWRLGQQLVLNKIIIFMARELEANSAGYLRHEYPYLCKMLIIPDLSGTENFPLQYLTVVYLRFP